MGNCIETTVKPAEHIRKPPVAPMILSVVNTGEHTQVSIFVAKKCTFFTSFVTYGASILF